MPVDKGSHFESRDVFISHEFEEVFYRWDHVARKIYPKFFGKAEHPDPVPPDNRLFNDALLFGDDITREEYDSRIL